MTWKDLLEPQKDPDDPLHRTRSTQLEQLLTSLEQQDRLFDYNVPAALRITLSDEDLSTFLRKTYTQPAFVVREPEEITRYAGIGDRVVKVGDYKDVLLARGATGVMTKLKDDKAIIQWDSKATTDPIDQQHLIVRWCEKGIFRDPYEPKRRTYDPDFRKRLAEFHEESWKRIGVEYVGPEIIEPDGCCVPDGTEGIILHPHGTEYLIVWGRGKDVRQRLTVLQNYDTPIGYLPTRTFSAAQFALVVPNEIDVARLG